MIRYALLLIVFVLVGGVNTVSAVKDTGLISAAGKLPSSPNQLALVSSAELTNPDTKRLLRQESVTTTGNGGDDDATEERAIITSTLKNALYKFLAWRGINPQTVSVKLGIHSGRAPDIYHRFYNSYQRWYATYGPRVYG
ncbi:hypothetical protein PC129_g16273 [Phytophthora cactorum]|uniref:RxLR effector protein n=1 Tax=Phytophthora cactorum TaxID=29920 RepID=A0A329RCA3_9STRA|nr:hypothetical protein Pcac1_g4208 [Phytophthora cactorum]KAG2797787.1 hypothetical protein PC111_g21132 [Phytophthora cactorum]KAG2798289.1 hypothetical protein PC112_g21419 [Phytophthora cactorum]KAG2829183.1 hypothetical protein PC113_g21328 [Phytophthora cactorum]KAG2876847.1 hypothetical protein PC114_g23975 [Phytophthora cactorum]